MARGWVLSLARLFSGIVRIKIIALALGVAGVGVFSILAQLVLTGVTLISMSLAVPIINLGRPALASGQIDEVGGLVGTALAVVTAHALVIATVVILFGDRLLVWLGIGREAHGLFIPVLAAVLISSLSSSFWEGMSYLCDRFDLYVKVGIVGAAADLLFIASGAATFGLRGAVFALPCASLVLLLAYIWMLRGDPIAQAILGRLSVRMKNLPRLYGYSAMMVATIAATNVTLTFLRSRVLLTAGSEANGYLQTATALASYILAFVMTGFWGHLHARAASEGDCDGVRAELRQSLRLGALIAFSGCGAAMVLAPYLLPIFYSRSFASASPLVLGYMIGEFGFQLLSMLIAYQLTVKRRGAYVALNLGYVAILLGIGWIAIPTYGAWGYVFAHVAAALITALAAALFAWSTGQVRTQSIGWAVGLLTIIMSDAALLLAMRGLIGQPTATAVALLPFAASGLYLLGLLRAPIERNRSTRTGACDWSE